MRGEEQGRRIELLWEAARRDGENIQGLARIAEAREHRLSRLEGDEESEPLS